MTVLKYADLLSEANKEAEDKSLEFGAKDGKIVKIRPLLHLGRDELKSVRALLKKVQDDKGDPFDRLDAMDQILVAAADRKDALKSSLADLPPQARTRIFNTWMKVSNAGESSA